GLPGVVTCPGAEFSKSSIVGKAAVTSLALTITGVVNSVVAVTGAAASAGGSGITGSGSGISGGVTSLGNSTNTSGWSSSVLLSAYSGSVLGPILFAIIGMEIKPTTRATPKNKAITVCLGFC